MDEKTVSVTPRKVFETLNQARQTGRRIVPLFGAGISIDAGIPSSTVLADYIVSVCAMAKAKGWHDYRAYLRTFGWPHRHDVYAEWLASQSQHGIRHLHNEFEKERKDLYQLCMMGELRKASPLLVRSIMARKKKLPLDPASYTDYRSLLAGVTANDSILIDAFFDHFIRGRQPTSTHQFIAFVANLLRINLILTTNFDPLIEIALRHEGFDPTVYEITREGPAPGPYLIQRQAMSVVKLHGGTHSLRTGYDLDDRLPISAMDDLRGYLKGDVNAPHPITPLLLVIGYSGSDLRVMDLITDHLTTWKNNQEKKDPLLIWISRNGVAPQKLKDGIQLATSSTHSRAEDGPVQLCEYRSGQLFLQELHQVLTGQHAVSQNNYRVIVSVPRSIYSQDSKIAPTEDEKFAPFRVYYDDKDGAGTSRVLMQSVYANFGSTHEIIWIDASEFSTRASIISQIHDELVQLDRGLHRISRPLLLTDVDYVKKLVLKDSRANSRPRGALLDIEQEREERTALKWIIRALCRSNYVIAIDSLGEFALANLTPNSDGCLIEAEAKEEIRTQRRKLFEFLGKLSALTGKLGRSVIRMALTPTPVTFGEDIDKTEDNLALLTQRNGSELGKRISDLAVSIERDDDDEGQISQKSRHDSALDKVAELISYPLIHRTDTIPDVNSDNFDHRLTRFAAGLLVLVASLFRRPRSRTALCVVFVRYIKIMKNYISQIAQDPTYHRLDGFETLNELFLTLEDVNDDEKLLHLANIALKDVEDIFLRPGSKPIWRLLAHLEGGFYWMHLGSRAIIFKSATDVNAGITIKTGQTTSASITFIPPPVLAELYDSIASFAVNDVYERSQDVSAFIEYLHYRRISVQCLEIQAEDHSQPKSIQDQHKTKWRDLLNWMLNDLESQSDSLRARGKLISLLDHMRRLVELLVHLDNKNTLDEDRRKFLHQIARRTLRLYAELLWDGGHARNAVIYWLWLAELMLWGHAKSIGECKKSAVDLAVGYAIHDAKSGAPSAWNDLAARTNNLAKENFEVATMQTEMEPRLQAAKLAIHLGRIMVDPLLIDETRVPSAMLAVKDWRTSDRQESLRRDISNTIFGLAKTELKALKTNNPLDGEKWGLAMRIREMSALLTARISHAVLNQLSSTSRFEWLFANDERAEPMAIFYCKKIEEKDAALLKDSAEDCGKAIAELRCYLATPYSQRIECFLLTIRAAALNFLGHPELSDVCFNRAHSVLHRPAAAGEKTAFAIALLVEAEAHIIRFRLTLTMHNDSSLPTDDSKKLRHQMAHNLQTAKMLLDQCRSLLADGRAENRWRAFCDFHYAAWHYIHAILCVSNRFLPYELDAISNYRGDRSAVNARELHLRSALDRIVSAMSNACNESDRGTVIFSLFRKIDEEGKKCFNDEWKKERVKCGIPETDSPY